MIHIVFQTSDVHVLQQAMALDPDLQGDVLQIHDDLAVGPLSSLDTPDGWQTRRDWWKTVVEFTPYTEASGMSDDQMTLHKLRQVLDADPTVEVWVWMAQNAHDVCGYYWLVNRLKDYQGRVQVLYLNNLPFLTEKGTIFYPVYLFEIQPSEFRKAKRLARPITPSEFEIDPDEWARLCQEDAGVRLLEGGKKIAGRAYDHFDKDLLSNITTQWQKVSRVLGNTLHRMKVKTGDAFLLWRLRTLVASGALQMTGDLSKGWTAAEVKLPGGPAAEGEGAEGAPAAAGTASAAGPSSGAAAPPTK
ncbi:DUF1835 domain-containing protein [Dinghuibacter silviterrae]|uniref:Uncharacterized protein DUF3658 n=1 Tax=Dinghuibacter silviterrae TaxID=1539049 RepID=A0A4R8DJ05_9BACT|nr:DUF1835 domain-containing protein [Dinghuibacter silviterrae]TDW97304.1 uncharacterized protein DUF3658 [Dinghuibacter silviterrae]